jgi:hypothetical protein
MSIGWAFLLHTIMIELSFVPKHEGYLFRHPSHSKHLSISTAIVMSPPKVIIHRF